MSEHGEASKQKIFFTAMEEFAAYGYERASTNRIVKNSGLSKGLLFHHYGNKHNLFIECCKYAIQFYNENLSSYYEKMKAERKKSSSDIMQLVIEIAILELQLRQKYPAASNLLVQMYVAAEEGLLPELQDEIPIFSDMWKNKILEKADASVLREDFDKSFLDDYVFLIVEAYTKRFLSKYSYDYMKMIDNLDELLDELKILQTLVKTGIYKNTP